MQIGDDTDIFATGPVYGNDCLHAQLILIRDVEQPGLIVPVVRSFRSKLLVSVLKLNSVMGTEQWNCLRA